MFKNIGWNIPGGNFLGCNFQGGGVDGWEFSGWKFSWYPIKYVSFIFPQATNKTFSICLKQLTRIKNLKRLNKLHLNVSFNRTDPLTSFLNNVPTFPRHLWTTTAAIGTAINVSLKTWIGSRKLNKHPGMNIRSLTAANKWNDGVLFSKNCIFCNKMDI